MITLIIGIIVVRLISLILSRNITILVKTHMEGNKTYLILRKSKIILKMNNILEGKYLNVKNQNLITLRIHY